MSELSMRTQSSQSKDSVFNLKNFGPGILMASAAIGGSHLIASSKAGAIYGWQLVVIILLANFFKYPFFRFSVDYTYDNGHSLVEGYARKSKAYLAVFFVLAFISAVINIGALGVLSAVILKQLLPGVIGMNVPNLAVILLFFSGIFSILGRYQLLDKVTKLIVISLTICTLIAVCIAFGKESVVQPDFVAKSPWEMGSLAFIIILMGWMPAPIEVSAINSLWMTAKSKTDTVTKKTALLDFNVGYIGTAFLAIVFLTLGALVIYGTGIEIPAKGTEYVPLLIKTYAATIGSWSAPLVAFIAFACIYGTTITVVDGYSRVLGESQRLFTNKAELSKNTLSAWMAAVVLIAVIIIVKFIGSLLGMLDFAMIMAFIAAPIFAWLNFSLVRKNGNISNGMQMYAWAGMAFLTIFTLVFLIWKAGLI